MSVLQKRPHVLEFGNWESQENAAHTVFFEKATRNPSGSTKMINPNNSREEESGFREIPVSPALGENHKRAGGETRNTSNTRIKGDAATVLKFGGWDENSPEAADGFTVVFHQARSGYVTPTRLDDGASSPNMPKDCCFPWNRKR